MNVRTLFVLGLAVGGLAVFGLRAMTLDTPGVDPHAGHPPAASPPTADPHAGHDAAASEPEGVARETPIRPDAGVRKPENTICPVMGNPVDVEVFVDYEGRRIGFCCPGCDALFLAEPDKYLAKVDAELAARAPAESSHVHGDAREDEEAVLDDDRAPENEICPVMGNPVDPDFYVDYEGRRIAFCCPGCDSVFMEDPEPYLEKVDAELAKRGRK